MVDVMYFKPAMRSLKDEEFMESVVKDSRKCIQTMFSGTPQMIKTDGKEIFFSGGNKVQVLEFLHQKSLVGNSIL